MIVSNFFFKNKYIDKFKSSLVFEIRGTRAKRGAESCINYYLKAAKIKMKITKESGRT